MNILYIHGFGSKFDPDSEKIETLGTIGVVYGVDLDYTDKAMDIWMTLLDRMDDVEFDCIVGTSLGGFWAALLGSYMGIPFVSINPAIEPQVSLMDYIGTGKDYTGKKYHLTQNVVDSYSTFKYPTHGTGLVLLDSGDEVLNHFVAAEYAEGNFQVEIFKGGSHRFEHMSEALLDIESMIINSQLIS